MDSEKVCAACARSFAKLQAKGLCNGCYLKQYRANLKANDPEAWERFKKQQRVSNALRYRAQKQERDRRHREWREANPLKMRNYTIKKAFGAAIDRHRAAHPKLFARPSAYAEHGSYIDWYMTMLEHQGGKCAIDGCGNELSETVNGTRWLSIDHCHRTGAIRGILCHGCNMALGNIKESLPRLAGLIRYIERHAVNGLAS